MGQTRPLFVRPFLNTMTNLVENLALFKKMHPLKFFLLIFPKADILGPLESNLSCLALEGVFAWHLTILALLGK